MTDDQISTLHRHARDRALFNYAGMAFAVTNLTHEIDDWSGRLRTELEAVAVTLLPDVTFADLPDVAMPPPRPPLRRWAAIRPSQPWSLR